MLAPALLTAMALASSAQSNSIDGLWLHPERAVIIRLQGCGSAMCGTVTWATARAQRDAKSGVEHLVGARLLTDFRENSNGIWKGKIFVPDYALHVTGKIQHLDANRLKVSGCTLGGLICRSQVWTRSDSPVATADRPLSFIPTQAERAILAANSH